METRDNILAIIKAKGPILPVQIAKEIGSNILMASAHLAELTASNLLKISAIKVGGSPLYYLSGQEHMLQKFTVNMNDKEKKAYDLLQQNKILRDSEQEPVVRVAIREIKDFAVPLNVNYNSTKEIFWKWFLTSDSEAEQLIKAKLNILERKSEEITQKEEIKETGKQFKEIATEKIQKEKVKERKYKAREKEDAFLSDVIKFFEKNKINVISRETIKKNSEIDFIIEIPSVVGNLQYFCRARNKKKISDADLSTSYVKGQFKKLPVLVLSSGDLSAKAQEMITKELKNLTFKKI